MRFSTHVEVRAISFPEPTCLLVTSRIARQALDEALITSVLTEISSKFLVSERYSMKSKSRCKKLSEWCDIYVLQGREIDKAFHVWASNPGFEKNGLR